MAQNVKNFLSAHHAYVIESAVDALEELLKMMEWSWDIALKGNPDFFHRKFITLGIDEARNLRELHDRKSFAQDGKKIFVIESDAITLEAQNSLLKMFEEPTENTYFFVLGNCVNNLIPTLASRLSKMRVGKIATQEDTRSMADKFLSLSMPSRLNMVKKLADDIKDAKKTKTEALVLIHQIEDVLYQKKIKESMLSPRILNDIELCQEYMQDRSAKVKMLLEHIALIVPHSV